MAKKYDYGDYTKEQLIAELKKLSKRKKYGLVWEEERTKEKFELDALGKLPVLVEDTKKEIKTDADKPTHVLIEGDNFHSLSVLNYTHSKSIDVIYIDPPYNKGNKDFKYNDRFVDLDDSFLHSKWLSFISKRLKLAKNLLKNTGVIFISIDNNEVSQLKLLCDEIFGEANFIEKIIWNKRIPKNDKGIGNIHEYILVYVKNPRIRHEFYIAKDGLEEVYKYVDKLKRKKVPIKLAEEQLKRFYNKKGYDRGITLYCNLDEQYRIWGKINVSWPNSKDGPRYKVIHPKTKKPTRIPDNGWRYKQATFKSYLDYKNIIKRFDGSYICGQMWFAKDEKTQPSYIQYLDNVQDFLFRSILSIKSSGGAELDEIVPGHGFPHPKTYRLIKKLLQTIDSKNCTILDFFAGSGTTGHAVLDLNREDGGERQFIVCTNNENNICTEVCYPRLKKIINGYKNSKKVKINGIKGNLKYYKTNFVGSEPTHRNKRLLTDKSIEMLCLKENTYDEVLNKKDFFIFKSRVRFTAILFNELKMEEFKKKIRKLKLPVSIYVFSLEGDDFKEEFENLQNDIRLCSIPEAILKVYRRIYGTVEIKSK